MIFMKRIDIDTFDYENREGEKIWCVEEITNNKEENSIAVYECQSKEEAEKECERLNKTNQDKRFKFIVIKYLIEKDGFAAD